MSSHVHAQSGLASLVGETIGQRYEVTRLIGQGGFGAVFRARHLGTGDDVAIKVLHGDHAGSPEVAERFRQEAAITASLKQPHTVRVFDFGATRDGNPYIAMEFLEGQTLTAAMADERPLGYERLGQIALQVLKSLAEAHARGLVHRDLKPDNIYLQQVFGEEDFVKVLDFGIAKSLLGGGSRTATGVIVGTPPYMSPEQAQGSGIDTRTDIYALGCILYNGLTGHLPFASASEIDTLIRRITEPPPDPRGRCRTPTPDAVCQVVLRAMATAPAARYATAQDMAKALTAALGEPAVAQVVAHAGVGTEDQTVAGGASVVGGAIARPTTIAAVGVSDPTAAGDASVIGVAVLPTVARAGVQAEHLTAGDSGPSAPHTEWREAVAVVPRQPSPVTSRPVPKSGPRIKVAAAPGVSPTGHRRDPETLAIRPPVERQAATEKTVAIDRLAPEQPPARSDPVAPRPAGQNKTRLLVVTAVTVVAAGVVVLLARPHVESATPPAPVSARSAEMPAPRPLAASRPVPVAAETPAPMPVPEGRPSPAPAPEATVAPPHVAAPPETPRSIRQPVRAKVNRPKPKVLIE